MSVKLGPAATIHRNGLPEELRSLFDWFTESLHENPLFFSSVLQSAACTNPNVGYWEAVALVKAASETESFQRTRELANRVMKGTEDPAVVDAIMKPATAKDIN
jgi:hypothetical protein